MAETIVETPAEQAKREAIILAAIGSAGPIGSNSGAWASKVREASTDIALMLAPGSQVSKNVTNLLACGAPFAATVLGGKKEESSTRVLVRILAVKSKNGEPEELRTERTDNAEGKRMVERVKALKGHKVLIYKQMETGADGKDYRVLRHVVDLGVDPNYDPNL